MRLPLIQEAERGEHGEFVQEGPVGHHGKAEVFGPAGKVAVGKALHSLLQCSNNFLGKAFDF